MLGGGAARGTILRISVLPRRGEESREHPEPAPALRGQPEEIYTLPVSDLHPLAPLLQAGVAWGVIPAPLTHSFYSPPPAHAGWQWGLVPWMPPWGRHIPPPWGGRHGGHPPCPPTENEVEAPSQTFWGWVFKYTRGPQDSGQARYRSPYPHRPSCSHPRGWHPRRVEVSPRGFTCQGINRALGRGSAAAESEAISVEKPLSPPFPPPLLGCPEPAGTEHRGGWLPPGSGEGEAEMVGGGSPACCHQGLLSSEVCLELRPGSLAWEPTRVPVTRDVPLGRATRVDGG